MMWPVRGGLKIVPERGAGSFGASREGGKRLHAGVDLPTSKGSAIVAMVDGRIASFPSGYVGLDAIVIEHAPPLVGVGGILISVILYAEFTRDPKLVIGETVKAGQVLGVAAASAYGSMLHLEFWQGRSPSAFSVWPARDPRPNGLLDPTFDLQQLAKVSA
jgi:murein DD-endopeptidase MepM/ murein hydrolase activator NlpD